jgi:Tfp pilus assembly protein PilF
MSTGRDAATGDDPREAEVRTRFARGESYLRSGAIEQAIANLKAALSLRPDDPDIKSMMALAVWRDASVDEERRGSRARALLAEVLAYWPSCPQAYRVFGHIYAERGQTENAIRCFSRVLELVPDDLETAREVQRLERKRDRRSLLNLFRKS